MLINCTACGKGISSTVHACPNCGAEVLAPARPVQLAPLVHATEPVRTTPAAQVSAKQPSSLWVELLRWLAILPASVAAMLVVTGGARFFIQVGSLMVTPLSSPGDDSLWYALLGATIPPALGGFVFVYSAVLIAPRFTRATAVGFVAIALILSGIQTVDYIAQSRLIDVIAPLCVLGGSIFAAAHAGAFERSSS